MREKVLLIVNPMAGRQKIRTELVWVVDELTKAGFETLIYTTQDSPTTAALLKEYDSRADLLICCGGDGTFNEILSGSMLWEKKPILGYIPAGTTNDFAQGLHLSMDIRTAVKDIIRGRNWTYDAGLFNHDYFSYVASFGAFTESSYATPQTIKNQLGHLAYILEGVKSLTALKSWKMSFVSEEYSGEGEFLYGMVTNSNSVGGFKGITGQDVTLNDGKFEVTLIRNTDNIIIWAGIINALLTGEENEYVISFKTSHLEVFSETPIPWTRDGEYGGSHTHAVIDNIPGALPLIVPQHVAAYENGEDLGYFEEAGEEDDDAEEILRE